MAKFLIQPVPSTVNWTGKKVLGIHTGSIDIAEGFIEIIDNTIVRGEIQMDMTSIVITDIQDKKTSEDFLAHLLHDDFFSVDKFKVATLRITESVQIDSYNFTIDGQLIIKNISHPIRFVCSIEIFTNTLHALGQIVIDRTLYNIRYGSGKFISNLGDKLIYDDFVLQFKVIAQA